MIQVVDDKSIKRQGLIVTIGQLKRLADELELEIKMQPFRLPDDKVKNQLIQINIINEEGLSDTWKIEHSS